MPKKDKIKICAALLLLGIVLLSLSGIFKSETPNNTASNAFSAEDYKTMLEQQMKNILSQISGIGEVEIMITLEGEAMKEIAYNESTNESATQTSASKDAILVKDDSGTTPYIVEEKYPSVVGVVVVAQGAENSTVKYYITEAVKAALNVGAHKIVVIPKN